jgi:hypothetical protein
VTAAGVGAVLGGAGGTVAGAGIAAVVTTVGDAVYQRSLERTRDVVRTRLHSRRPTGSGAAADPDAEATTALDGPTVVLGAEDGEAPSPGGPPWRRYALLVATGLLIFLVALLAITGIERIKGSPLSGGERGTSVGSVFGGGEAPTTTTTTTAPSTEDSAPTSAAPQETAEATTTTEAPATTTTSRAPTLVPTGLLPN